MLARPEQTEARVDSQAERLERRFSDLVDTCSRFSREIVRDVGWNGGSAAVFDPSAANGEIARTVFGKWSLDILTLLYMRQSAGVQQLRRTTSSVASNQALTRKRGGWVDVPERAGRSLREVSARGPKSHP